MKKLFFAILLLTGCSGAIKFGPDGKPDEVTAKNIQVLIDAVNQINANLKGVAEATADNTLRVHKLETKK